MGLREREREREERDTLLCVFDMHVSYSDTEQDQNFCCFFLFRKERNESWWGGALQNKNKTKKLRFFKKARAAWGSTLVTDGAFFVAAKLDSLSLSLSFALSLRSLPRSPSISIGARHVLRGPRSGPCGRCGGLAPPPEPSIAMRW